MFDITTEKLVISNLPRGIVQPRRAQIYVGFQCHQQCGFCYYKNRCNEKMFQLDKVKKQIDFEYAYGIREFEITGGEPSEYAHLKETCEYIKKKDNECKISIITNGGLWNVDIWDLIDEVLVSYHLGKQTRAYDKAIFPRGCTYDKAKKTIDQAKLHNVMVRSNTVLGTFNLMHIDDIVDDLLEFKPSIINFLPVNLFDQAKDMVKYIDYNMLRRMLKNAIDKINQHYSAMINVRYMPFCDMEGYEQYIVGTMQHIYDKHDWNRELDGTDVIRMSECPDYCLAKLGKYGSTSVQTALNIRKNTYCKSKKCLSCKYNILCDGVERTEGNVLEKYITPSYGKPIKNILHYGQY